MANLASILTKHPLPDEIKKLISPSLLKSLMEESSRVNIVSLEDWEEYATRYPEMGKTVKEFIREAVRKELAIAPEGKKEGEEGEEEEGEDKRHRQHTIHPVSQGGEKTEEEKEREREKELKKLSNKEALEKIKQHLKEKGVADNELDTQARLELMRLRNEQFIQQRTDQREQVKTHFADLARQGKIISQGTQETPLTPPQQRAPVQQPPRRKPVFFGRFLKQGEPKKPGAPSLRHRVLDWASRGRYSAAKQAFSSWAARSRIGRASTRAIGGINRFAKILNLANLARHPGEAARSYAEQYAAQKALGFAGQQLGRLGGMAGRTIAQFAARLGAQSLAALGTYTAPAWVPVVIIVGIIILFIIFIVVLILNTTPSSITKTPIPGLNLTLSGPKTVQNSENVQYSVGVTYNPPTNEFPIATITIVDKLPDNATFASATGSYTCDPSPCDVNSRIISWSLGNAENRNGFTITLKPTAENIVVENMVFAATTAGAGPPAGGSSGNSCTQPYEGTGYCSVGNLTKIFGDPTKTLAASMICQAESGSDPFALNPKCPDYSVGLFQINLIAHCSGAYGQPYSSCTLINENRRNACEVSFKNPGENISYAGQLSTNGSNWRPWSTWSFSGKGPAIRDVLTTCGIKF